MKKTLNKGFTLIELLVVVAIIGILASVILASLNSARAKGVDAATKSDLSESRAQAELYYDGNGSSYAGVCLAGSTATNPGINTMMSDAVAKLGTGFTLVTSATTPGSATTVVCHDSANAWAATVPLKAGGTNPYFCIDSTGQAKQGTKTLTGSGTGQFTCQ